MTYRRVAGSLTTLVLGVAIALSAAAVPASADIVQSETAGWQLSPADAVIEPGESVTYTAVLVDTEGVPVVPQPATPPYIGTDAAGDIEDGMTITAFSPGPRAVMAVGVVDGVEYFGGTSLTVVGDPVSLTITPSATTIGEGGTLSFEVSGFDEWDAPVDASAATLTSSVASDVIEGHSVTFPTASPHTITATLDGLTASVTIEVVPAATSANPPSTETPVAAAQLAATGTDPLLGGVLGGALLLAGAASLLLVRRRIES